MNFNIKKTNRKENVYDVTVKNSHSFTVGKNRMVVHNCSGNFIADTVYDFYESQKEVAMLSKNGFGTSSYLGDIRHRGSNISSGGKASGVLPVLKDFIQLSRDISQGCYDKETEILTEKGWMSFAEVMHRDIKVAQVTKDNFVEFVYPLDRIEYNHNGTMIEFNAVNVNLLVTPNHNMTIKQKKGNSDEHSHISAENIKLNSNVVFTTSAIKYGEKVTLTNLEKFLLAINIASFYDDATGQYIFKLNDQNQLNYLEKIINSLNYEYEKDLALLLVQVKIEQIKIKFLEWIKLTKISHEWGKEFIEELGKWSNSNIKTDGIYYFSIEKNDIDLVQAIATISGFYSNIYAENDVDNQPLLYTIVITDCINFSTEKVKKTEKQYNDTVYCVTVPTHNLIVRRNGIPIICGNSNRRGAWAGYIEIEHKDFWEIVNFINTNPDDCNIGWVITNDFIEKLNSGDKKALERYQKAMKTKMITGKGYFFFVDKVNEMNPKMYLDNELRVKASNLCISADSKIEFSMNPDGSNSWVETIESFNEKASLGYFEDKIYVKSYNIENEQFEFKEVHTSIQKELVNELYEIEYEPGKIIRCTGDHKILTKRGYVQAKDLIEQDEIVTA